MATMSKGETERVGVVFRFSASNLGGVDKVHQSWSLFQTNTESFRDWARCRPASRWHGFPYSDHRVIDDSAVTRAIASPGKLDAH